MAIFGLQQMVILFHTLLSLRFITRFSMGGSKEDWQEVWMAKIGLDCQSSIANVTQ